jgi:hypothetical protein
VLSTVESFETLMLSYLSSSSSTERNSRYSPVVGALEMWDQRQTLPVLYCARQLVTAAVARDGGSCVASCDIFINGPPIAEFR